MAAEVVGAIEARATIGRPAGDGDAARRRRSRPATRSSRELGDDRAAELARRGASTPVENIVAADPRRAASGRGRRGRPIRRVTRDARVLRHRVEVRVQRSDQVGGVGTDTGDQSSTGGDAGTAGRAEETGQAARRHRRGRLGPAGRARRGRATVRRSVARRPDHRRDRREVDLGRHIAEPGACRVGPEPRPRRRDRRLDELVEPVEHPVLLQVGVGHEARQPAAALRRAPDDPHQPADEGDAPLVERVEIERPPIR